VRLRRCGSVGAASSSSCSRVGVPCSSVTCSRSISSSRSAGSFACTAEASTSVPPQVNGPSSSSTEMSNETVVDPSTRSWSPKPVACGIAASRDAAFQWLTITPLGVPVEPDVKIT
jgi:hypothetical protein